MVRNTLCGINQKQIIDGLPNGLQCYTPPENGVHGPSFKLMLFKWKKTSSKNLKKDQEPTIGLGIDGERYRFF